MPDQAFQSVLAGYHQRMAEEEILMARMAPEDFPARRDEFLLSVGADVGRLINGIAVGLNAQIIVELGTSHGYSTLHMADAARQTGGKVFSYDLSAAKQDYARARLAEAGLSDFVEWRLGNAVELLADQPGPIDFALIDIWKDLYIPCLEGVYPKLAVGGIILADNMIFPAAYHAQAEAYRAAVREKGDLEAVTLRLGQGIDIACKLLVQKK